MVSIALHLQAKEFEKNITSVIIGFILQNAATFYTNNVFVVNTAGARLNSQAGVVSLISNTSNMISYSAQPSSNMLLKLIIITRC